MRVQARLMRKWLQVEVKALSPFYVRAYTEHIREKERKLELEDPETPVLASSLTLKLV